MRISLPSSLYVFFRAACVVSLFGLLTACFTHPSMAPLLPNQLVRYENLGIKPGAKVFVRIFKQEKKLEIWLEGSSGHYKHFNSYSICSYSGKLGPKQAEGDKQAPEGFYHVNKYQLNPNSSFHLSFDIGFPNAYDRSHNFTGSHLMVHGGCLSSGCYAITDSDIEELYAVVREAFKAGQKNFPLHAFPFRMTDENMEKYKDKRWQGFWENLKQGYDIFEETRIPPKVSVRSKRYVFKKQSNPLATLTTASTQHKEQPKVSRKLKAFTN